MSTVVAEAVPSNHRTKDRYHTCSPQQKKTGASTLYCCQCCFSAKLSSCMQLFLHCGCFGTKLQKRKTRCLQSLSNYYGNLDSDHKRSWCSSGIPPVVDFLRTDRVAQKTRAVTNETNAEFLSYEKSILTCPETPQACHINDVNYHPALFLTHLVTLAQSHQIGRRN